MKKAILNLKHYSIIFSILGILVLYSISSFCKPSYVEISKIPEYEGKEIITNGTVKQISETKYGNQIITIEDNKTSVLVFSEEKTDVEYGDIIKVQGKVQKYEKSYEIIVENKQGIEIINRWDNKTIPLWQLSLDPSRYVGINIKVKGFIDSIYNSYFTLKDTNKSETIVVSYSGGNSLYLDSKKEIIVKGVFTFDSENFRYVIKLFNKDHGVFVRG